MTMYGISAQLGNGVVFKPASYGFLSALNGGSNELMAINLDNMVLDSYNIFSYYRGMSLLNNGSASIFAQIDNINSALAAAPKFNLAGGYTAGSVTNPGTVKQQKVSDSNGKKGTKEEKEEYQKLEEMIEQILKKCTFTGTSDLRKSFKEIKNGSLSYADAIKKLKEIAKTIKENAPDKIQEYANDLAKDEYKKSGSEAKNIANNLKTKINKLKLEYHNPPYGIMDNPAGNEFTGVYDSCLTDLVQEIDKIDKNNVVEITNQFNIGSSCNIIRAIQNAVIANVNGRHMSATNNLHLLEEAHIIIKTVCEAMVEAADELDLNEEQQAKVNLLIEHLNKDNLIYDSDLAYLYQYVDLILTRYKAAEIDKNVAKDIKSLFSYNDSDTFKVDGAMNAWINANDNAAINDCDIDITLPTYYIYDENGQKDSYVDTLDVIKDKNYKQIAQDCFRVRGAGGTF